MPMLYKISNYIKSIFVKTPRKKTYADCVEEDKSNYTEEDIITFGRLAIEEMPESEAIIRHRIDALLACVRNPDNYTFYDCRDEFDDFFDCYESVAELIEAEIKNLKKEDPNIDVAKVREQKREERLIKAMEDEERRMTRKREELEYDMKMYGCDMKPTNDRTQIILSNVLAMKKKEDSQDTSKQINFLLNAAQIIIFKSIFYDFLKLRPTEEDNKFKRYLTEPPTDFKRRKLLENKIKYDEKIEQGLFADPVSLIDPYYIEPEIKTFKEWKRLSGRETVYEFAGIDPNKEYKEETEVEEEVDYELLKRRKQNAAYDRDFRGRANPWHDEFWKDYMKLIRLIRNDNISRFQTAVEFEDKWSKRWEIPVEAIRAMANTPKGREIRGDVKYGPLVGMYEIDEDGNVCVVGPPELDLHDQCDLLGCEFPDFQQMARNMYFVGRTPSEMTDIFLYDEKWVVTFPLFYRRHDFLNKGVSFVGKNIDRIEYSKFAKYIKDTRIKDKGCYCKLCIKVPDDISPDEYIRLCDKYDKCKGKEVEESNSSIVTNFGKDEIATCELREKVILPQWRAEMCEYFGYNIYEEKNNKNEVVVTNDEDEGGLNFENKLDAKELEENEAVKEYSILKEQEELALNVKEDEDSTLNSKEDDQIFYDRYKNIGDQALNNDVYDTVLFKNVIDIGEDKSKMSDNDSDIYSDGNEAFAKDNMDHLCINKEYEIYNSNLQKGDINITERKDNINIGNATKVGEKMADSSKLEDSKNKVNSIFNFGKIGIEDKKDIFGGISQLKIPEHNKNNGILIKDEDKKSKLFGFDDKNIDLKQAESIFGFKNDKVDFNTKIIVADDKKNEPIHLKVNPPSSVLFSPTQNGKNVLSPQSEGLNNTKSLFSATQDVKNILKPQNEGLTTAKSLFSSIQDGKSILSPQSEGLNNTKSLFTSTNQIFGFNKNNVQEIKKEEDHFQRLGNKNILQLNETNKTAELNQLNLQNNLFAANRTSVDNVGPKSIFGSNTMLPNLFGENNAMPQAETRVLPNIFGTKSEPGNELNFGSNLFDEDVTARRKSRFERRKEEESSNIFGEFNQQKKLGELKPVNLSNNIFSLNNIKEWGSGNLNLGNSNKGFNIEESKRNNDSPNISNQQFSLNGALSMLNNTANNPKMEEEDGKANKKFFDFSFDDDDKGKYKRKNS